MDIFLFVIWLFRDKNVTLQRYKQDYYMDKKMLRQTVRRVKGRHDKAALAAMDEALCRRIEEHPLVRKADVVLLYWSLPDEVCTHGLVERLSVKGKTVLLPKVISDTEMTLHRFSAVRDMQAGAYGILEPQGDAVSVEWLEDAARQAKLSGDSGDVVGIIPGMAFDEAGHRLGRGKGYYDRMLARLPDMYRIGLCYPFQLLPEVPAERHDAVMDEVIC